MWQDLDSLPGMVVNSGPQQVDQFATTGNNIHFLILHCLPVCYKYTFVITARAHTHT